MKIIIAGSRCITDRLPVLIAFRRYRRKRSAITAIISGTAKGPDRHGEWIAERDGIEVIRMPADWNGPHGKRAGFVRNQDMANIADGAVIVWDGVSSGTRSMIAICRRMRLDYEVYDLRGMRRIDWEA